ncbi:unnamed protein product [Lathyrus sativus]|nr:unnamed protein product [Lathyrus sativus]
MAWERIGRNARLGRKGGISVWKENNGKGTLDGEPTVSFFITEFPDKVNAKELFEVFKVYGVISEVFIAGRHDKRGRRFGFAKFRKVHDPRVLACNLDSIVLEGKKMHANIPRFSMDQKLKNPVGEKEWKHSKQRRPSYSEKFVTAARSFANMVSEREPKPGSKIWGGGSCANLEVDEDWEQRLKRMRVGIVMEGGNAFNIQKIINEEGFFNIKVIPMGASKCLLEDNSGGDVEVFIKEARDWLELWFSEIRPWD